VRHRGSSRPSATNSRDRRVFPQIATAIGLAAAEDVFFLGFTGLPANATMCQARKATEAQARALFGTGSQQEVSTNAAWNAVGVPTNC
jgi:Zn-dependent metalloprotease